MSKRTFLILMGATLAATIIGIVLICLSSTPYHNLSYWLVKPYSRDAYLYAQANIGKYTAMYYSGFALAINGGIGMIVSFIIKLATTKRATVSGN